MQVSQSDKSLQCPTFSSTSFIMHHHGTILKENIQMGNKKNLLGADDRPHFEDQTCYI